MEHGAQLLIGGAPVAVNHFPSQYVDVAATHGSFFAPTVLSGVTKEMNIFRTEVFGPVMVFIHSNLLIAFAISFTVNNVF